MAGSLVTNYLKQGLAASRPAAPSAATDTVSWYYATDTTTLSFYDHNAAGWVTVTAAVSAPYFGGRLTLTSATPVLSADVTGATTIYYALYSGSVIAIYNGTSFVNTTFTELSQLTTDNTKSPAAVANNSNYDLFVWSDSGTLRCTRGPAWTSDTGRGTGAGTTELERVTGIWVNKVAITNGPTAQRGTYVGTVRSNGTASIDMIMGGTGGAGGESSILGVWNMYNRVLTTIRNYDNSDSWTYTTATWRLKNAGGSATANRILFVIGLQEDAIEASNRASSNNGNSNIGRGISIGLNSTSAYAGLAADVSFCSGPTGITASHHSLYSALAPLGFNYLAPLEISIATGTTTWYGDNAAGGTFTGLTLNSMFSVMVRA